MPDYFRFGLPLAVCIALGAALLMFAFAPTIDPPTQMHVIPGIETDVHPAPYTADEEAITSAA